MYIPKATTYWEAIAGGIQAVESAATIIILYGDGTYSEIDGAGGTGTDLYLVCNEDDFYPHIRLRGDAEARIHLAADKSFEVLDVNTEVFSVGTLSNYYHISIKETGTSPPIQSGYGLIYTKSDNKLYFRDGDGTEHTIAFV